MKLTGKPQRVLTVIRGYHGLARERNPAPENLIHPRVNLWFSGAWMTKRPIGRFVIYIPFRITAAFVPDQRRFAVILHTLLPGQGFSVSSMR